MKFFLCNFLLVVAAAAAAVVDDEVTTPHLRSRQLRVPDPKTVARKKSLDHRYESTKLSAENKLALGIVAPTGAAAAPGALPGTAVVQGTVTPGASVQGVAASGGVSGSGAIQGVPTVGGGSGVTAAQQAAINRIAQKQAVATADATTAAVTQGTMTTAVTKDTSTLSRRKFVAYIPSPWESVWKEGISEWETDICSVITGTTFHQPSHLRKYMDVLCTKRYDIAPDWCYLSDGTNSISYNMAATDDTWELYVNQTPDIFKGQIPPSGFIPVLHEPGHEDTFSKFVFLDETTGETYFEYIEPLVSALRFPLAHCVEGVGDKINWYQGYVMPPPAPTLTERHDRKLYFDVGGDKWRSFQYIVDRWGKWDGIYSYPPAAGTIDDKFFLRFPASAKAVLTRFQDIAIVQEHTTKPGEQFLPDFINTQAKKDDYVLLKLEKGDPLEKEQLIQYILDDDNAVHVDEIVWQHNLEHNYLLKNYFARGMQKQALSQQTFAEAYDVFTQLRQKGIRAHSWI